MNMNLELGSGLDRPSFFEVAAQERVIPSLYAAFEHAVTVRSPAKAPRRFRRRESRRRRRLKRMRVRR